MAAVGLGARLGFERGSLDARLSSSRGADKNRSALLEHAWSMCDRTQPRLQECACNLQLLEVI